MYKLTQLILFFVAITTATAQSTKIEGTVTDANNSPLLGVNVSIKNAQKGAQTDTNGHFKINGLSEGNYTITFSYVGFKNHEVTITLSENETKQLSTITLYEGNEILQRSGR